MPRKVLIVEDDKNIADLMRLYLEKESMDCQVANDGLVGLEKFQQFQPDLVMLDIMLPGMDGWSICRKIRETSKVPIIMLTAKGELEDKVNGLELGADDYITKPFLPQELLLRLHAVLRRVYREDAQTARLGDAEIDWGKSAVHRNGVETALTAKEFTLLRKLWDARGNIVTIDALCAALWDGPLVGYENTLMVHIRRLREKIEAVAGKIYRADGVDYSPAAAKTLDELTAMGYGDLPVCIAKTQYSFSDNAALKAAPTGFRMTVREVRLAAGAGFVVVICGSIMTMPGLPKTPAAVNIDVTDDGRIVGLF